MFLHLGRDVSVTLRDIIYIQDFRQLDASEENRRFWQRLQKARPVEDVSEGSPKALVLTDSCVYLSAISPLTLKKRAEFLTGR